jgi:hypothetical protein
MKKCAALVIAAGLCAASIGAQENSDFRPVRVGIQLGLPSVAAVNIEVALPFVMLGSMRPAIEIQGMYLPEPVKFLFFYQGLSGWEGYYFQILAKLYTGTGGDGLSIAVGQEISNVGAFVSSLPLGSQAYSIPILLGCRGIWGWFSLDIEAGVSFILSGTSAKYWLLRKGSFIAPSFKVGTSIAF